MQSGLSRARMALDGFFTAYLVKRDMKQTLPFLAEDLYSIGTGERETARSKNEFARLLRREIEEDPIPFSYRWKSLEEKEITSGIVEFLGKIEVSRQLADSRPMLMEGRMTALFKREADGQYRACSFHMSMAAAIQEEGEFYPIRFGRHTLDAIREDVQRRSFELMSNAIAGGMMGGYLEEGYPIYFVNEQMLSYLGYGSFEEFYQENDGKVITCIHPEDREGVEQKVDECFSKGEEYQVTYRMRKRDGSFIWVLDHGKKIVTESGRPAITSVCIDITEQVELQQKFARQSDILKQKNEELERFYHTVVTGIAKISFQGDLPVLLYANSYYFDMLGIGVPEQSSPSISQTGFRVYPADQEIFRKVVAGVSPEKRAFSHKVRILKQDGTPLWVRIDGSLSEEDGAQGKVLYCLFTDIDSSKEQEEELRKQQYFISLVLTNNTIGTMITYYDKDFTFAYVGENLISFLGCTKAEFECEYKSASQIIYRKDLEAVRLSVDKQLSADNYYEIEYRLQKRDGKVIWVMERGNRAKDEDGRGVLVCVLLDISKRKRKQDQLVWETKIDPLTGVYNRRGAEEEVARLLTQNSKGGYCALLLLDLDNFKQINDRYGHVEGDKALCEVCSLLTGLFHKEDIIARLGGDEFSVFVHNMNSEQETRNHALAVCKKIEEYFTGHGKRLSVSIGIAPVNEQRASFEALYQAADRALYRAKGAGKNTVRLQNE